MQTNLEATLATLVSIPSLPTNATACHDVLAFVRNELKPLDLFVTESKPGAEHPWFYATTQQTKKPDVLLAAHLDVVAAPQELFVMQKHGDKLYGRGVYDMKLAAACYVELLKANKDTLRQLNIGVLFTTDEEYQGRSMLDVLATGLRPKAVFLPDGGDNWHVEKRAKGLQCVRLTARGKTAHGSRPWEGENALHTLLDVIQVLRSKYPSNHPSAPTLAVNKIEAGEAPNQIPDYASVMIDFRSFSKQDLANYRRLINELAKKHNLEVQMLTTGEPLAFDAESPAVQGFLQALSAFTGDNEVAYCESYGASDARYFAEYDIPCIIIEPHGGGRHADDEWLLASDLSKYYRLLEQWLFSSAAPAIAEAPAEIGVRTAA